jgi:hypothetical protein
VRVFFVHIGHFRNELMTLRKLLWASQQYETTNDILVGMRAYQSLTFTRLLAGKLQEGWELLRKAYFGAKLSLNYEKRLDNSGQKAIASLKLYFDQKGLMHDVRNQFAFHYAPDKIRSALADLEEPTDLKIYVSDQAGNTYYQFSEVIVNTAEYLLFRSTQPLKASAEINPAPGQYSGLGEPPDSGGHGLGRHPAVTAFFLPAKNKSRRSPIFSTWLRLKHQIIRAPSSRGFVRCGTRLTPA